MLTYESVAQWSQLASLLMFVAMFAGVVIYAMWPANDARFRALQSSALDIDGAKRDSRS